MKSIAKFAAVAMVFSAASQAGVVTTTAGNTSTGSSLVLLLKDNTGGFYVESLAATVSSLNSFSSLQSTPAGTYSADSLNATQSGSLTMPSIFSSFSSSNLSTWLTGRTAGNVSWTILGAALGNGSTAAGQQIFVVGSKTDMIGAYPSDANTSTAAGNINNFFVDDLNAATFTNGSSSTNGYKDATGGANAGITFISSAFTNGTALGTGQALYEVATGGTTSVDPDSAAGISNVYKSLANLTLNANGTFSYSAADLASGSPVPVPAAVWLLGSGLAGLVGIGRRRKLAA